MSQSTDEQQPYAATAHLGLARFRDRGVMDRAARTIAASWADLMTADGTTYRKLDGVLGEPSSERDAMVAATVIKWLGTSLGMNWLRSAFVDAGGDLTYPPTN